MVISFCGRRILSKNNFLKVPKRNGYIVLVPEIGENLPMKHPLLKEDKTPEFNSITVEKCVAAMGMQTLQFEEHINMLGKQLENDRNVDVIKDILLPLEDMFLSLESTWGVAKTLYYGNQSLMPTNYYSGIHDRGSKAYSSRFISIPIYEACKNAMSNKDIKLTDQQRRMLSKFILEGRLNGLELSGRKKKYFYHYSNVLINDIAEFRSKLEVATNQLSFTIKDVDLVKDFPEDFLKAIAVNPSEPNAGPWVITMRPGTVKSFMEHCLDRAWRFKIWLADVTKASLFQDTMLQTSVPIEKIREKKCSQAELLGYNSYAEMSMETKMAGNLDNLYNTLDTLLQTARPAQEQEIHQLNEFARDNGLDGEIMQWDVPYWRRKQRDNIYKYNNEDLRNYFPLLKVLSGVFELVESLFKIKIVESKAADIWHKDVRYFDIFDLQQSSTNPIANFYLDPYARGEEKVRMENENGWMLAIKSKSKACNEKPLAALIFNFQPPIADKPSLLSLEDVNVLFQKFGHMLQHLLTKVEYAEITGFSFVEWDAVYISDHFFANWLTEPSVLRQISSHYKTQESLSPDMIETLRNVRSYFAGYDLCNELYLSHLDLELYSSKDFWSTIMKRLWAKYFVIPYHKKDSHLCSFHDIFSGSWAAAYYSNVWSKMIAADLYSAFKEVNAKDNEEQRNEISSRYRETFLALGGSCPTNEIFRKFRGRDPSPKALLNNLRLYKEPSDTT